MEDKPSFSPNKVRKKLLRPRSQKYYSRKAKIEQALLSLEAEKLEHHAFSNIPSSAILYTPHSSQEDKTNQEISYNSDHEILCIPTKQSSWCSSTTKIENFHLPTYITQLSEEESLDKIPKLLSMDSWRTLPDSSRSHLMNLLPNFDGLCSDPEKERMQTLELLFSGANFHFGNPIESFLKQLAAKRFQPQKRRTIQNQKLIGQFSHVQFLKERNQTLIRKVAELKNEVDLEDEQSYLLIPPTHRQFSASHLCSGYVYNSDTDADSGGDDSLSVTSQKDLKEKLVAAVSRKDPVIEEDISNPMPTLGKRKREGRTPTPSRSLRHLLFDGDQSDITNPPGPVWIFFTILRDLFITNNYEMTVDQLVEEFNNDEQKSSCVTSPYTGFEFISMGLHFLSAPPLVNCSESERRRKSRAKKTSQPPSPSLPLPESPLPVSEYQVGGPFVACADQEKGTWRWVGCADEDTIREELDTLELLFYYAVTRKQVSDCKTKILTSNLKQQKCTATIRKSTDKEKEEFQQQEEERYAAPERPYRYKFRDYETVVAPMKRGLGNQSQKPRDHFLLQKERPPHISLLCVVRDAAARLPGGIGTRPDVAILLCDSQYVVQDVSETKLNSVVSGALDRLHAQADPCVRYDSEQKLWIYLHRRRNEDNFPVYKASKKKGRR